jgi:hypothetical protein
MTGGPALAYAWKEHSRDGRHLRGIRSSGKLIKMVDHAQGWQGVEQVRLRVGYLSMTWATWTS